MQFDKRKGDSYEKIKFFPAPHMEIRVSVTDEMVADLRECKRIAEESNYKNLKDCGTCSWREVEIPDTRMCELDEVRRQVLEEDRKRDGKINNT